MHNQTVHFTPGSAQPDSAQPDSAYDTRHCTTTQCLDSAQPDSAVYRSILHEQELRDIFISGYCISCQAVLCSQTVQCTCLEASAVALTASRREADSLALELDSSISIARSVSACMEVKGHIRKEL